jgi:DMSO/TMAO reductase YedYZ molybdopterin-dependent catalytic subunit
MPSRTLVVTLECAGNGRSAMHPPAEGEPWGYGAASTAEWTGVPLAVVLSLAGVRETAREIVAEGSDSGTVTESSGVVPFARSLPLDKAQHEDTILAYAMNGEPLPVDHGFPVRLIVPGWYGMASVKWIRAIRAVPNSFGGFFQVDRYVMVDPSSPNEPPRPLREICMRSIIIEPGENAILPPDPQVIRGLAWSGVVPVTSVDVSVDGGATWEATTWTSGEERYAWRAWEYIWEPTEPGPIVLASRARDAEGTVQPEDGTWNSLGYANNAIQRVHVAVEGDGITV